MNLRRVPRTRWVGFAALFWFAGCTDMCGSVVRDSVRASAVSRHEYASAEAVWPHIVAVLGQHGEQLPPSPPPPGQPVEVPIADSTGSVMRVTLERGLLSGDRVRVRVERVQARPEGGAYPPASEAWLERTVLERADPAAFAQIQARASGAGSGAASGCALAGRGCSAGLGACDATLDACGFGVAPPASEPAPAPP